MKRIIPQLLLCVVVVLEGCGGGGGSASGSSGSVVASTQSFPLREGIKSSVAYGATSNYTIAGYCNGQAVASMGAPITASFEGASGVSSAISETWHLTNCTPSSITVTGQNYYDGNYVMLGASVDGGEYTVYAQPPNYPVSVKVGDVGPIGTMLHYQDSTKAVSTGSSEYTYVVEADTADTIIVDVVSNSYNASGVLSMTTHTRSRMYPSGELLPVSIDILSGAKHFLLTAYDNTPPAVISVTPSSSSSATAITATFNEAIDPVTINNGTFSLVSSTGVGIGGTVTFSGRTATFTPDSPFMNTTYTARITTGVKDRAGNNMPSDYTWIFLPDVVAPAVISMTPADSSIGLSLDSVVTVTFDEPLDPTTVTDASFILLKGSVPVPGTVTYTNSIVTFTPATFLQPNTAYTAKILPGVTDMAGNPLAGTYSWSFTTDASFQNYVTFPIGALSQDIAIGDVNNDGRNDVVAVTSGTGADPANEFKLVVFLQDANGGLSAPIMYTTQGTSSCLTLSVAIGDVNHDGLNDVVAGHEFCGVEVFTQNTSGMLGAGVLHSSTEMRAITIADVNNDSLFDVVGAGAFATGIGNVIVWRQNTAGGLNAPISFGASYSCCQVRAADINNDGLVDVLGMRPGGSAFSILYQGAGGTLGNHSSYGLTGSALMMQFATGDVNGDGLEDVVATYGYVLGGSDPSSIGVFYQNAGTLSPAVSLSSFHNSNAVEIADVSGDGLKDVVVVHDGGSMGIYLQLPDGSLQGEKRYPSSLYPGPVAVGDINGDGKNDIVLLYGLNGQYGLDVYYHN